MIQPWAGGRPSLGSKPQTTEPERAYAAGFLDGEGSIHMRFLRAGGHRPRDCYFISITVTNTNEAVLVWLKSRWGGAINVTHPEGPNVWGGINQKTYVWRLWPRLEARQFLQDVEPWVQVKQRQLALALEWFSWSIAEQTNRAGSLKEALGKLNARGARAVALLAETQSASFVEDALIFEEDFQQMSFEIGEVVA